MNKIELNAVGYIISFGTVALVIQGLWNLQFNIIGIVTLMLNCIVALRIINNYKINFFDAIFILNFILILFISDDNYLRIIFNQVYWFLAINISKLLIQRDIYYNFKIIQNFIIISALLIGLDILLTLSIKYNAFIYGEGLFLTIFQGPFYKIIGLLSFPLLIFLGIKNYRYYFLVFLILIPLILGSRSVVLALLFELLLLGVFGFVLWRNNKIENKNFIIYLIVLITSIFSIFLTSDFRKPLIIDSSIQERFVIWDKNISLFLDQPLGVGSSKSNSIQTTLNEETKYLGNFIKEDLYAKRLNILKDKINKNIGSEESFYLYFIVNFGVFGVLILVYIFYKYLLIFINIFNSKYCTQFIFLYVGTIGLLVHGVFNNYNSVLYILIPVLITVLLYPKINLPIESTA